MMLHDSGEDKKLVCHGNVFGYNRFSIYKRNVCEDDDIKDIGEFMRVEGEQWCRLRGVDSRLICFFFEIILNWIYFDSNFVFKKHFSFLRPAKGENAICFTNRVATRKKRKIYQKKN